MNYCITEIAYKADLEFTPETIQKYSSVIIDIFNEPVTIDKYINIYLKVWKF